MKFDLKLFEKHFLDSVDEKLFQWWVNHSGGNQGRTFLDAFCPNSKPGARWLVGDICLKKLYQTLFSLDALWTRSPEMIVSNDSRLTRNSYVLPFIRHKRSPITFRLFSFRHTVLFKEFFLLNTCVWINNCLNLSATKLKKQNTHINAKMSLF